jgi:hypothetical protein
MRSQTSRIATAASVVSFASLTSMVLAREYQIEPSSVPLGDREFWCQQETTTCPLICAETGPGTTLVNTCDPQTLTYGCLCGNDMRPNVSEYSLTLPYFVCREWGIQCVDNCPDFDNACASSCTQDNPCGALNPQRVTTSVASATAAPTSSSTDDSNQIFTDTPGSDNSDNDSGSNNDNAAVSLISAGRAYGLAVVLGGMFVGFAIL